MIKEEIKTLNDKQVHHNSLLSELGVSNFSSKLNDSINEPNSLVDQTLSIDGFSRNFRQPDSNNYLINNESKYTNIYNHIYNQHQFYNNEINNANYYINLQSNMPSSYTPNHNYNLLSNWKQMLPEFYQNKLNNEDTASSAFCYLSNEYNNNHCVNFGVDYDLNFLDKHSQFSSNSKSSMNSKEKMTDLLSSRCSTPIKSNKCVTESEPYIFPNKSLTNKSSLENTSVNSLTSSSSTIISNNSQKKCHIKKPLNAFMLFMKEMRARVVSECTLKESAAINQILGRRWHSLTREEQSKYYEMARQEKELHQKLYPNWSARDNYASHSKKKKRRTNNNNLLQNATVSYLNGGSFESNCPYINQCPSKTFTNSLNTPNPVNISQISQPNSTQFYHNSYKLSNSTSLISFSPTLINEEPIKNNSNGYKSTYNYNLPVKCDTPNAFFSFSPSYSYPNNNFTGTNEFLDSQKRTVTDGKFKNAFDNKSDNSYNSDLSKEQNVN